MNSTDGQRRVLVADDVRDAADSIAWLLRLEGFDAVAAYDGAQAAESARVFKPHLAILDIDMPVLDGFALARTLRREQAPGTRLILIALSGRTAPADVQAAIDAGFDRHVGKPIPGEDLCALVRAFLGEPPTGPSRHDKFREESIDLNSSGYAYAQPGSQGIQGGSVNTALPGSDAQT